MLRPRRVVAGRLTSVGPLTRRIGALSAWAALLGSIAACGTDPQIPTSVNLSTSAVSFTYLGQTQQLSPSVTDQDGKPVSGANVSWSSSNTGVATVSPSGVVTAVAPGSADITATAGSATATAQVTVVQTPTQLLKVSGDGQTGAVATTLSAPLVVQVTDAGGSPIPGTTVTFAVSQGEGSAGTASAVTGNDGRASTSFTLGTDSGSPQEVSAVVQSTTVSATFTATVPADPAAFNIGLRFLSGATPAQRLAFHDARVRWEAAITQDLEDELLDVPADSTCGTGWPAVTQNIDDVMILVMLAPIDGPGKVLGSAGPCWIRDTDNLTLLGAMQFDTADLQEVEADGLLSSVILHEMGHVLGIGTLWDLQGLLADPSLPSNPGADPHFTGAQATGAFDNAGGVAYVGGKVPVENTGGVGRADAHWRETVFGNELMTGLIGTGPNPLSRITLASLADQGYSVNLATADGYSLPPPLLRAFDTRPKLSLENDILRAPIRKVDRHGRVTGEFRR